MEIVEGVLQITPFFTATIAMVVLFVGKWLNHRVRFLCDFNIPEPVVGGLLFSILFSAIYFIFDLEVAFLFPWAVAFRETGAFGFWSMMIFLGVLTIGFIYEWRKGALEWD